MKGHYEASQNLVKALREFKASILDALGPILRPIFDYLVKILKARK